MPLIEALSWRYATKKFDAGRQLAEPQLHDLFEAARLAPTSFNLQPFRFVVVTDAAIRARLREAAFGQPQVTDAAHLVVLAAETDVGPQTVSRPIDIAAAARHVPRESLAPREAFINTYIGRFTPDQRITWSQKQAYLALGVLLAAAAEAGIDAAPMEGFDPAKVDAILGLPARSLTATVLLGLGFRAADDTVAHFAKARKAMTDTVLAV